MWLTSCDCLPRPPPPFVAAVGPPHVARVWAAQASSVEWSCSCSCLPFDRFLRPSAASHATITLLTSSFELFWAAPPPRGLFAPVFEFRGQDCLDLGSAIRWQFCHRILDSHVLCTRSVRIITVPRSEVDGDRCCRNRRRRRCRLPLRSIEGHSNSFIRRCWRADGLDGLLATLVRHRRRLRECLLASLGGGRLRCRRGRETHRRPVCR